MSGIADIARSAQGAMGGLSAAQNEMIAAAPKEMQPFLASQMKMQKEQELNQLIGQLVKQLHEMSMALIKNTGG